MLPGWQIKKCFNVENKVGLRKQAYKYAHTEGSGLQSETTHFLIQTSPGDT